MGASVNEINNVSPSPGFILSSGCCCLLPSSDVGFLPSRPPLPSPSSLPHPLSPPLFLPPLPALIQVRQNFFQKFLDVRAERTLDQLEEKGVDVEALTGGMGEEDEWGNRLKEVQRRKEEEAAAKVLMEAEDEGRKRKRRRRKGRREGRRVGEGAVAAGGQPMASPSLRYRPGPRPPYPPFFPFPPPPSFRGQYPYPPPAPASSQAVASSFPPSFPPPFAPSFPPSAPPSFQGQNATSPFAPPPFFPPLPPPYMPRPPFYPPPPFATSTSPPPSSVAFGSPQPFAAHGPGTGGGGEGREGGRETGASPTQTLGEGAGVDSRTEGRVFSSTGPSPPPGLLSPSLPPYPVVPPPYAPYPSYPPPASFPFHPPSPPSSPSPRPSSRSSRGKREGRRKESRRSHATHARPGPSPSSVPIPLDTQEEAAAKERFTAQLDAEAWNQKIMAGTANGGNLPLGPVVMKREEEGGGREGGRDRDEKKSRWRDDSRSKRK